MRRRTLGGALIHCSTGPLIHSDLTFFLSHVFHSTEYKTFYISYILYTAPPALLYTWIQLVRTRFSVQKQTLNTKAVANSTKVLPVEFEPK